jgi:hypothetical protein
MGHATIKKYRRKTMKNKNKGKKLHLKKNLKLRTKQKNAKKTQKRFRLKNKTKRVKKMKKIKKMKGGDEDEVPKLLTFPDREDDKYKKKDGKFDGAAYMKAIQAYNKQQAEAMHVENPTEDRVNIENIGEECTNVDPSKNPNENEYGGLEPNFLKFQFEGKEQIYCYNYEDILKDLDNIGNICCVWKKTNPEAEDNEEGYGTSCIVRSTYDLLGNACNYINDPIFNEINNPEEHTAGDDYLCVWKSLINIRTWISQKAVKEIYENKCNSDKGKFILKNPKRTLIGNLYNVFGVGMLHGQQPGEFIFDIEFELDNTTAESCTFSTSTDFILDKRKLLTEYGKIYDQFWNDINVNNESYDPNDDSFGSQSSQSSVWNFSNVETPPITPPRTTGTPIEQMSPISPNRQLFDDTPNGTPTRFISVREDIERTVEYIPYLVSNDRPLTMDDLSPWAGIDEVLRDIDTARPHHPPIVSIPIVSIPTNATNDTPSVTDGFVYLSPGSSLRPISTRRGNTFDNNSSTPMVLTPPRSISSSSSNERVTNSPIHPTNRRMLFPPTPGAPNNLTSSAQPASQSWASQSWINDSPNNPNLLPPVPLPYDNFPSTPRR